MTLPATSGLSREELRQALVDLGHPAYRADQWRRHLWGSPTPGFEEMANLPAGLRSDLSARFRWSSLHLIASTPADRGLTEKLLFGAGSGDEIEAVMIRHPARAGGPRARRTVCVSSQAGCAIGCVFCATGRLGLRANLGPEEIVDQVLEASRRWAAAGAGPPTNVVYMGMGEPLQNYRAVVRSVRLLHEWGVPLRQIVISTSGMVPEIHQLAAEGMPLRLAISLHAADNSLRERLVPLNRRYPIEGLMDAARDYTARSGRRVSLEYVLIREVNDDLSSAVRLRRLADSISAHVNLIPMNPIPGSALRAPDPEGCREFAARVGPRATIRFSRGDRAQAACGQLRATLEADPRRAGRAARATAGLASDSWGPRGGA